MDRPRIPGAQLASPGPAQAQPSLGPEPIWARLRRLNPHIITFKLASGWSPYGLWEASSGGLPEALLEGYSEQYIANTLGSHKGFGLRSLSEWAPRRALRALLGGLWEGLF